MHWTPAAHLAKARADEARLIPTFTGATCLANPSRRAPLVAAPLLFVLLFVQSFFFVHSVTLPAHSESAYS